MKRVITIRSSKKKRLERLKGVFYDLISHFKRKYFSVGSNFSKRNKKSSLVFNSYGTPFEFSTRKNIYKKSERGFQKKLVAFLRVFIRRKVLLYFVLPFFIQLIVILLLANLYISNVTLFSAVLSYEYKKIEYEDVFTFELRDGVIVDLEAEDGVSVSEYATGTKVVGERAKGYVSVFNATSNIIEIKAGTKIVCISERCNGLEYIAEADLNLGPGSASDLALVAADIGENFNVPINAGRFKIANYNPNTEVVASNIRAITGGTPKKNVMIVTADDIQRLKKRGLEELNNYVKAKIINSPNYSKYLFFQDSFKLDNNRIELTGDKEGDEKDIVNISIRAKGYIKAIPQDVLKEKIEEAKKQAVPQGYYLDSKTFSYNLKALSIDDKNASVLLEMKAIARLDLDISSLKAQIAGKKLEEAIKILEGIHNVQLEEVVYSPDYVPSFMKRVPSNHDQIRIQLLSLDPKNTS